MNEQTTTLKTSPRDFLMYILVMITLYVGTYNFLQLIFQYINIAFPDPLNYYYDPRQALRWPIAILVILFPVYLWASRFLRKEIMSKPERAELRIRKWLVYLTLFLSALLIIGDLVALVYNFLQGDFTTPFLLKVVVVLATGGSIFAYYLQDLRRGAASFTAQAKMLSSIIIAIVGVAVVAGFFVAGSPFRQRMVRFDEQRISNLQEIQSSIVNYWMNKNSLPPNLNALRDSISGFIPPVDPETKTPYTYQVKGALSFDICALFDLSSASAEGHPASTSPVPAPIKGVYPPETWDHPEGQYCFTRTIDPQLYRPAKP